MRELILFFLSVKHFSPKATKQGKHRQHESNSKSQRLFKMYIFNHSCKVQAHLKIFKPIVYFILLLFSLAFVREDCAQFCPTLSRPCGL